MKIGFIGLGSMGGPMADRLAAAGHQVTGFDVIAPAGDRVRLASSLIDAVTDAEVVITMLPNGEVLDDVVTRLLKVTTPGTILCDCSTIAPDSARAIARQSAEVGVDAIDAPVSGGPEGAVAGTLTFMVGGPDATFQRMRPLMDAMGRRAVHCGESGAGQVAKLCNNMMLAINMIGTCEAFAMADRLGLSAACLYDVVSTSSGGSWSLTNYCPVPGIGPVSAADRDYRPGFPSELMLKDLRIAQQAAATVNADTPLGALATRLYETFVEVEGGRGRDFSAMMPRFAARLRDKG